MKYIIVFTFIYFNFSVYGQLYEGTEKKTVNKTAKAAACTPPNTTNMMDLNNTRILVHTAGNLWQVPGQNFSMYEVPKNSGIMCIFTGSLWLGGTDLTGQLKLAALRYRDGQDYWNGPLTQDFATVTAEVCEQYDQHFISTADEVREFKAWFQAGENDAENGTSTQTELFPNYVVPSIIKNWPAHGDVSQGQDYYLAPYFDYNENGSYDWENGDYPWYDLDRTKECGVDRRVSLYGDINFWWIMNDKGNIHTETQSEPIGMEIRAQAFSFASNDEINNMTFYNYELINRGTQTLANTYFGSFTDGALGNPYDDFVGCDVNRGLGYYYNGNNFDADNAGFYGYGDNPPAVGVDFFEGPFQDNDGIDNAFGIGTNEALNGIGYGDGIIDNERFGMRRFLYYSNTTNGANINQTDPINAIDYYNYLRGIWKDGSKFIYGGSGHISDPEADPNTPCDFMFPGDTDPLGWGTNGIPQVPWTEETAQNLPNDKRFVQSAGPFVLVPGAVNNITVGVVWARATSGGPFASVEVLRRADDKAQALFENCFRVLDGPHAPELDVQEIENGLILYLSNTPTSNNYNENYEELDPFIVSADPSADKKYRFQGYQVYQLVNDGVSSSELTDPSKARLVAQCDIKDEVSKLINFEFDANAEGSYPTLRVDGSNEGIKHAFHLTEDAFASGDKRLINFKTYHYMAIAYGYNNYAPYNPTDPGALDGQKKPYLPSRKAALGEIKVVSAVPHNPIPEIDGTYQNVEFGTSPRITRLDGTGNGYGILELTTASENQIVQFGSMANPTYELNGGPIKVKVVDPLNVAPGYFELKFRNYNVNPGTNAADTARWTAYRYTSQGGTIIDSILSEQMIKMDNEQLIPQWGVSIQIHQNKYVQAEQSGPTNYYVTDPLSASISFVDSNKRWMTFVSDNDQFFPTNWIRSGTYASPVTDHLPAGSNAWIDPKNYKDEIDFDNAKTFAKLLNGGVAPHRLTGYQADFMPLAYHPVGDLGNIDFVRKNAGISYLPSVNIVITSDKSKWTRCPVIEMGRVPELNVGGAKPGELRKSPSVNKEMQNDLSGTTGMGWFPGYAIDLETGTRMHMAFGENSFLSTDRGNDMNWNPTSRTVLSSGEPIFGGVQPIWVFAADMDKVNAYQTLTDIPAYNPAVDETSANFLQTQFDIMQNGSIVDGKNAFKRVFSSLMWVGYPLTIPGKVTRSSDLTIKLRMNKEYKNYITTGINNGKPMYSWNMDGMATSVRNPNALADALKLINVVPNPYYAFSEYEKNRIDSRIKITNLPEKCSINIYGSSGKLIKSFEKDSPVTWVDWLLVNSKGIPIGSGVYFIHVNVPGTGEVVLKSFIAMRQVDLQGI